MYAKWLPSWNKAIIIIIIIIIIINGRSLRLSPGDVFAVTWE